MTHHTPEQAGVEDATAAEHPISCTTCMKEVPASAAKSEEATGYVHYFCGLDCLQDWQKQNTPTK